MTNPEPHKPIDVLIVDDEADICFLLTSILSKMKLKTSYVTSLSSAKKMLNNQEPQIVFIDNHLPDGFGINFIGEIKHQHPHTKVIMITAYDTKEDKSNAMKEGADYFIGKPFTREVVLNIVNDLRDSAHN